MTGWARCAQPAFQPPQTDKDYPYRAVNFDGLYEQPHDNFHGWIGPDMADNAYTAFDPIFLAYHSKIDRMLEIWLRGHPGAQFTAQTVLQPFIGADASDIDLASPQTWRYTAIGAMAQDSRRIGYDYGPPVAPQFKRRSRARQPAQAPAERMAGAAVLSTATLWVVFDDVRCTRDSYLIDVFLEQPRATAADADARNPHYVGRFSRIGMGMADDKGRCIRTGVSRVLNAARCADALGLAPGSAPAVDVVVTHLDSGRRLMPEEYSALPGFMPELVWGDPRQPMEATAATARCKLQPYAQQGVKP